MSIVKKFKVIGIMSGTSMDGLDFSFLETDGENHISIFFEKSYYYSNNYKFKLKKIIDLYNSNKKEFNKSINEKLVTKTFSQLINKFIKEFKIDKKIIDFIGLSGQTIYHNPKNKKSIQYGSCRYIQKKFKIKVIGDFRKNDIKNGGQGAPIGAYYHKYIIEISDEIKEYGKNKNLILFTQKFQKYIELLNNFTYWLGEKNKNSKDDVSAACNDYLKVLGYIGLAHSWLKILKVSYEKLDTNKSFFEDKINTATYYFDKILPRVQSHYLSAVTGSNSMMKANFN